MKYTITLTHQSPWYRAHAIDNEKNEEMAIESTDPHAAMKLMADAIADRELSLMESLVPGWASRRSKYKEWVAGFKPLVNEK